MDEEDGRSQEDKLAELYEWIATIPFSKPTKNLGRDFSDAVLMAEVLKVYYPRYVDLHNYVPASNINTKRENWNTLNRKVLIKIDMKLNKNIINQLANAQQGVIEKLLLDMKSKVSNLSNDTKDNAHDTTGKGDQRRRDDVSQTNSSEELSLSEETEEENGINPCFLTRWKKRIMYFAYLIIGSLCFWKWIRIPFRVSRLRGCVTNTSAKQTEVNGEDDVVPRVLCSQLKQQLRERNDVICTLNHKVAYLESVMKLQDLRLSNLTSQILQNAVEMDQLTKTQSYNGSQVKSRTRPLTLEECDF